MMAGGPLRDVAMRVVLLWGWRRALVAALAGAAGALALAPLHVLPALLLSLTLAVWLLDGAMVGRRRLGFGKLRSAFVVGWCFGFGYHLAGLWWLGAAFIVDSDEFLWALPLGVLGVPAGLALFHGLGFLLARLLWSERAARVLALAAGLGFSEWLRSTVLTGFPWNLYGQMLAGTDVLAQGASLFGVHGLTVLAIAIGAAPAVLGTGETPWQRWRPLLAAGLAIAVLAGYGAWRLGGETAFVKGVKLRVMQPNVLQRDKNRMRAGEDVLAAYLRLSDRATGPTSSGIADVTHLIWPETPFPFLLAREPAALQQLAGALRPGGTMLITGAIRAEAASATDGRQRYFNSVHVVAPDGTIASSYDKLHLVPFGEYLPFHDLLTRLGLRQFVHAPGGFEAGRRRAPLAAGTAPAFLPLICYEAIFPDLRQSDGRRPGWLLNVTNDGWFGITSGPHQHLAQARLRAVEQGLPLVRAANTGISAVFDGHGRTVARLPLGVEGVLDSGLPLALAPPPYVWWGDRAMWALLALACVFGGWRGRVAGLRR
jgi:apolipoprotein N-acyltransferase